VGLDREQAARFSFLLSAPIILLAGAKEGLGAVLESAQLPGFWPSAVGFVASAITGYVVIAGLLAYLRKRPLYPFAAYCAVLGVAVITWQSIS
jgi:undecaprenyl-diphosphatase